MEGIKNSGSRSELSNKSPEITILKGPEISYLLLYYYNNISNLTNVTRGLSSRAFFSRQDKTTL